MGPDLIAYVSWRACSGSLGKSICESFQEIQSGLGCMFAQDIDTCRRKTAELIPKIFCCLLEILTVGFFVLKSLGQI